jgi:HD superfamily phosphohydrolase
MLRDDSSKTKRNRDSNNNIIEQNTDSDISTDSENEDESPNATPANKKTRLLKKSSNPENCSFKSENLNSSVFKFSHEKIYELLVLHGVSPDLCDFFFEAKLDGKLLESWPSTSQLPEFTHFIKLFIKEKSHEKNLLKKELIPSEYRHLHAIIVRYKLDGKQAKFKIFCDSVHGQIRMHPLLIRIVDTPQFQRLRRLKQLGILNYIYHSANHTRFEHCVGTSHLAGKLITTLKERQPALRITLADELSVRIAGLCHDLGHGPFSHLFEEVIEKLNGNASYQHEIATLKLFDRMFTNKFDYKTSLKQEFESYALFENDIQLIKDMIYSEQLKEAKSKACGLSYDQRLAQLDSLKNKGLEKSFLFEIVSNNRNGIDVDKFDYFDRDCKYLGFTNNFNHQRYIETVRVIKKEDGLMQISVRDKEAKDIYEMYHVREMLTRRAYKHETGAAINFMFVEALVKADSFFNFSKIVNDGDFEEFEKLDDGLEMQILCSNEACLTESRTILEKVSRNRNLYKFIGSAVERKGRGKKEMEESFQSHLLDNGLRKEQIDNVCIEVVNFNYGYKDKNPIDKVSFYDKHEVDVPITIKKSEVSTMLLNVFEDTVMRIFSKDHDLNFQEGLYNMFKEWSKNNNTKPE